MTKENKKKHLSAGACIGFCIFLIILTVYIVSCFSARFADFINSTLSSWYRLAMAKFGELFPFSLFELLMILLPLFIIIIILLAVRRFRSGEGRLRFVLNLLSVILVFYSGHLIALGISYNTTPLPEKMDISMMEITEENLADTLVYLRDEANELSKGLDRNEDGTVNSGYSLEEMSKIICASYSKLSEKYSFIPNFNSTAKGIRFSSVMSYLSLSGIYTFYTGEANVNTMFPDYDTAFTAAHEMSHQRGILRENEANFMAYLVLSLSENQFMRYSAALSLYGYVASALNKTNPERYAEISAGLDDAPRSDLMKSSEIANEYGDTFLSDISHFINDLFLKSNGTEGVISYGMVTKLAVAYLAPKIQHAPTVSAN